MDPNNRINFQAYIDATLGGVLQRTPPTAKQIRRIVKRSRPIYAVTATPKSGSTFLSNVLAKSQGLPYIPLCYAYSSNEHDLYLPALVVASVNGAVSQLHMKGTPHNVQLLNLFGIRPIVLTRNIFDSVESLARDLRKKTEQKQLGLGVNGYSFVWLSEDIAGLDEERLIDYVIDFALPWYVNFYVSWQSLAKNGVINPLFVRYEDLMNNKKEAVTGIIRDISGAEVDVDSSILEKNYISKSSSISRGTGDSGLGVERLTDSQMTAIRKQLSYYPEIDFSSWLEQG